jgi:hypothetical protein
MRVWVMGVRGEQDEAEQDIERAGDRNLFAGVIV